LWLMDNLRLRVPLSVVRPWISASLDPCKISDINHVDIIIIINIIHVYQDAGGAIRNLMDGQAIAAHDG